MNTIELSRPSVLARLGVAAQWVVFAGFTIITLVIFVQLPRMSIADAPAVLLYASVGVTLAVAIALPPPVFLRLPRAAKLAAYVAILPAWALLVACTFEMRAAYKHTPAGQKEEATRAEAARRADAEWKKADALRSAQNRAAYRAGEPARQAEKVEACNALLGQVVDGEKVLEVNDVAIETSTEPNEVLTCGGNAITSQGNVRIEFGLVKTPQGKELVSIRYR